jgi:hypothetical protein
VPIKIPGDGSGHNGEDKSPGASGPPDWTGTATGFGSVRRLGEWAQDLWGKFATATGLKKPGDK